MYHRSPQSGIIHYLWLHRNWDENSSYSLTICAERTAVFQAVLEDENEFEAIAISSDASSSALHAAPADKCY